MGAAAELDGGGTLVVSDSTIAGNTTQPAGRGAIDNFGGQPDPEVLHAYPAPKG